MLIDDKRIKVNWQAIGLLPLETLVQFHDGTYAMIVSHECAQGVTSVYDFTRHKVVEVTGPIVVVPCTARIVIEGGARL